MAKKILVAFALLTLAYCGTATKGTAGDCALCYCVGTTPYCIPYATDYGWGSCRICKSCPLVPEDCPGSGSSVTGAKSLGSGCQVASLAQGLHVSFPPTKSQLGSRQALRTSGIDGQADGARGFIISNVLFASPAFQAGLRPGDRIVAVNGRDAALLPYKELMEAVDASPHVLLSVIGVGESRVRSYNLAAEEITSVSQRLLDSRGKL